MAELLVDQTPLSSVKHSA